MIVWVGVGKKLVVVVLMLCIECVFVVYRFLNNYFFLVNLFKFGVNGLLLSVLINCVLRFFWSKIMIFFGLFV